MKEEMRKPPRKQKGCSARRNLALRSNINGKLTDFNGILQTLFSRKAFPARFAFLDLEVTFSCQSFKFPAPCIEIKSALR